MSTADKLTISTLLDSIKNLELKLKEESKRNAEMFLLMYKNAEAVFDMQSTLTHTTAERDELIKAMLKLHHKSIMIGCDCPWIPDSLINKINKINKIKKK